ncbi:protein CheW [Thermoclostridium stercorarium subsp. stercorarium DSM 8532]|jgi:purine-binding chemotaxis protein CheW|uniref:Protein CheW n=3 Tax=Thermoclostridium stercorarium TaxID=1510 RepID=L7VQV4_THES1|nr:chemotaxis protein CheW [Thermoclostridium stercorarium]AGC68771.1 protein CheW [Thermoclostridium stercorarium subsp. stercorarium DSM 8532]AGI39777.1 chemotaxis signal transduction protein [Thermoclostridium stercorarium subsp. stercorarium DSM 8532]ANW99091.1 chemotaxis protein CheW [Thermoclostridium stercorarium subsp. thermolacticum DSM 2910]UZQ84740.1 chemotaxis protein CheW [Thermoclostridium stercorarium]
MMDELLNSQYVVYELAGEKYALKISDVYEIIKMQNITPIHNSKAFLEGIINLRGRIIPVANLHRKFGLPDYTSTKKTRIIVVKSRNEMIGIVVDKVNQVIRFSDIQPPPEMVAGIDGSYFEGVGITDEGVISILNIDKVLYE